MKKRVVITGMGVVSSSGIGADAFWGNIKSGKCGISRIERFDPSEMPTTVAAEIKNFDPQPYMDKKEARRMDRYTQYAIAAADMAVSEAKIKLEAVDKSRMGVIIGSGVGGIETMENQYDTLLQKGADRVSPFFIPMMISNMAAGQVAIRYGAKGFNECVVTACATGSNAIGDAFKAIQRGTADVMIAGGAEAPITPLSLAGFCSMKAMSANPDPLKACRPFDKERDGFIMGEGAGILVLEEYEHAKNRGVGIVAEIIGYGCTCDAYHITSPSPDGSGAAACMQAAIDDANVLKEDIGYINAHGTSTPYNDKFETNAIKAVFKEHAIKLAISSTKSMTGHLLGAAGAIEAIISALALKDQYVPATINYCTPDPECDLDYVPNQGRKTEFEYALSNSLGFGGHNATLVFKRFVG